MEPRTRKAYGPCKPEARMAGARTNEEHEKVLKRSLMLATEAMDLLDAHGSDPKAAAYFALAQQQLRRTLSGSE